MVQTRLARRRPGAFKPLTQSLLTPNRATLKHAAVTNKLPDGEHIFQVALGGSKFPLTPGNRGPFRSASRKPLRAPRCTQRALLTPPVDRASLSVSPR